MNNSRTGFRLASCLALGVLMSGAGVARGDSRELQTDRHSILMETIANDVEHPWAIALLPDGEHFLVTERNSGSLRLGDREGNLSPAIAGVPDTFRFEGETSRSQGGLFDVKLDPRFEQNRRVYLSYSKPTERGAALAIARGTLDLSERYPRLRNVQDFWVMADADQDSSGLHFGGRMAWDPNGDSLYLTVGERRNISRAQDKDDQAGSVLRIGLDGNPPADNPFIDDNEANPFVFAYGNRNPQGIAFAPDGQLWVNDHGPRGGDELNRIESGKNYGWPLFTAGTDYSGATIGDERPPEGIEPPALVFRGTVAPSGLVFYQGEQFSDWDGDALNGGMAAEAIVRVRVDGALARERERIDIGRRVRDLQIADDGAIWIVTDHEDGEVMRLTAVDPDDG